MPELLLTPAAISYLTQFVLLSIITSYLVVRMAANCRKRPSSLQDRFLLVSFCCITFLFLIFFLDNALLPSERVIPFALENPVIALVLTALIQFSYHFPYTEEIEKVDRYAAMFLGAVFFLVELSFFIQKIQTLSTGTVIYRSDTLHNLMMIGFAWVVLSFAVKAIRHRKVPAAWNFTIIMMIPLTVAVLTNFLGTNVDVTVLFPVLSSIGLTFTIFLFVMNYLSSQPDRVSIIVKLSGAALTSVLVALGILPFLITPAYADHYTAPIQALDHRTLRFSPDGTGGYLVEEIPFHWEDALGEPVPYRPVFSIPYKFDFPFFGNLYHQINIAHRGSIGLGEEFQEADTQYHFTVSPMIFLMVTDLWGQTPGETGVYIRLETGKAVITWNQMAPNFPSPTQTGTYTFQSVLFGDGRFDITYNGLPELKFYADSTPSATAWVVGIKPAQEPQDTLDLSNLPIHIGPQGALQDENRAFRVYLHHYLLPLAIAILFISLAFMVGSALLLNVGLAQPLKKLLEGVQSFNAGKHGHPIPVRSNDEVGFLTESFNSLSGELDSLIRGLEQRVSARTRELAEANTRLSAEMGARAAAQAQALEQQRAVAALEERERLARDLHDGIGQVLGFINVQAQSAGDAVRAGDSQAAGQLLARVVEVAQEAHNDVRGYILGLKKNTSLLPQPGFLARLEDYGRYLLQNFGFEARLVVPPELPLSLAESAIENQLLYIIREALSNARAYSGQKAADVTLSLEDTIVQAVIQDLGVGFLPYTEREHGRAGHLGLEIMRERAEQSGGSLVVESTPGAGTRVTVRLPRSLRSEAASGWRVLLVDDHPLFLEGMANLMVGRGMQVVGVARDGLEAQEKARELSPDVILMDIEMPRCSGLEALRRIRLENASVKVIMLTVSGEEQHLFEALRSGASGYLLKSLSATELTGLLDELLRGEVSLSPVLASRMLEAFTRNNKPIVQATAPPVEIEPKVSDSPAPVVLTERQAEILRLVAQGFQYKEVALQLGLAEVTIKYHMGEILARLHMTSRREAVQYFQNGMRRK